MFGGKNGGKFETHTHACPQMKLNDVKLRNAKPKDKPYRLFDGGGLYLEVMPISPKSPSGGKLWRLKYRFGGKEKRISFGKYPTITLEAARKKRDEAKKNLEANIDPSVVKFEEKVLQHVSSANTFEAIAREWLEKKKNEVSLKTYKNIEDRLEKNLFIKIGKLPIKSVTAPILIRPSACVCPPSCTPHQQGSIRGCPRWIIPSPIAPPSSLTAAASVSVNAK